MHYWRHFKTITEHKLLVMKGCFRIGLYKQGLLHDLSKFSPTEFLVGAKYYQGIQSPNNAERKDIGYSSAWLHHKGRNKHHYEYWLDYSAHAGDGLIPVKMPDKYIAEMFVDRVSASKIYNKGHYTDDMPLNYYKQGKSFDFMHPYTREHLELLLNMLATQGEEKTFRYVKDNYVKKKDKHNH